jgi:hypothetical protein
MIKNKYTDFIISDPDEVIPMPEHMLAGLRSEEQENHFIFVIPIDIDENSHKTIYKLGWLKRFYTILYPKYSAVQIYREINQRWQIFVGVRQMERLWIRYTEIYQDKEEQ